jgi:hypothetical protein
VGPVVVQVAGHVAGAAADVGDGCGLEEQGEERAVDGLAGELIKVVLGVFGRHRVVAGSGRVCHGHTVADISIV